MITSLRRMIMRIKITEVLKFVVAAAIGFTLRVMIEASHPSPSVPCSRYRDITNDRLDINSIDVQLREQYEPVNSHGVIEYRFLDLNHVFDSHGAWPKQPLKNYHLRDLNDVLMQTVNYLNLDGRVFKLKKLHSGYERIDPLRGKEYILDVEVENASPSRPGRQVRELFRVSVVKPFSTARVLRRVHVAKLPPGSISLVVAMHVEQYPAFLRFMDIYENFVGRFRLGVTLSFAVYRNPKEARHKDLSNKILKHLKEVKERASSPSTVKYSVSFQEGKFMPYIGRHHAMKELTDDSNIVLTDLNVNLTSDFYLRCEATIQNGEVTGETLVYAPIPYSIFKLTDMSKAVPNILPEINRETGYWDHNNLQTFCMKKAAYTRAGSYDILHSEKDSWSENEALYERFVKHKIKIIRSVDPAVFVSYHEMSCAEWMRLGYMDAKKCRELYLKSIGSRTMLADRITAKQLQPSTKK